MKLNILAPMITDDKKLVFMDFTSGKTYNVKLENSEFSLNEIGEEVSQACFDDIADEQEAMAPEIPVDEIRSVLNTEKGLSEQNEKHIFRRK